jgi:hypothetical protein
LLFGPLKFIRECLSFTYVMIMEAVSENSQKNDWYENELIKGRG